MQEDMFNKFESLAEKVNELSVKFMNNTKVCYNLYQVNYFVPPILCQYDSFILEFKNFP